MIGQIAKVLAYKHAPRAAAALFHPKASARLAHTKYDMKHGYAPRISAVAVALLAVPVGFLVGKVMNRRTDSARMDSPRMGGPMTPPPRTPPM